MRAISYQKENMNVIFTEGSSLLEKHYKEIARYQDIILDPDKETYFGIEKAGALEVFTARENEELIGYAVYFVKNNLHYKSSLQAIQDIIFIHPEKRGLGHKLISFCDEELKKRNVQVVYHHVKSKHNFGPMLERQGYELVDLIYGKRLDQEI